MSLATPEKIRMLQRKLYGKAKREPQFWCDDTESPGEGPGGSVISTCTRS